VVVKSESLCDFYIDFSDVARPLNFKTKTTYFFKTKDRSGQDRFFKTKTALYKDRQITSIKSRPQKIVPLQKKIKPVMPVLSCSHVGYAGNRKKYLIIIGFLVKFCFIQN